MDDQRSAWSSRDRLAQVEEQLEKLQNLVGKLKEVLQARPEPGGHTAQGGWGSRASSESSNVPGRGDVPRAPGARARPKGARPALRPLKKPSRDQDPIGCVEIGVEQLEEDIRGLFRVLGATVPDHGPWVIPPRDTGRSAPEQGPRSGDQTDGGTGGNILSDLEPSKGPGGSGPRERKPVTAEEEDPRFDF